MKEVENEIPVGSAQFSDQDLLNFLAELTQDIDDHFEAIHETENEVQILVLKNNGPPEECDDAKATGKFPCNQKEIF